MEGEEDRYTMDCWPGPIFKFETGSLFETEQYKLDALCIFIPCGLTAIRVYAQEFVEQFGDPILTECGFELYKNDNEKVGSNLKYILLERNPYNHVYDVDEMIIMVDYMLDKFDELGMERIGLNGIRIDEYHPESSLVSVMKYLTSFFDLPEYIYFIDKRGGFRRWPYREDYLRHYLRR